MPWTCPACRLAIRHSDAERDPRPSVTYRCHVCRLELVVDTTCGKMVVAPVGASHDDAHRPPGPSTNGKKPDKTTGV
jgi:hypothetical protein